MRRALAPAGRAAPRRAAGAEGGGEYFASMTDLMLGLVFIFVIMLMVLALDMRQAERRMSEAADAVTQSELARSDLLRDLMKVLGSRLPVTIDEDNGTLSLGGDILFPRGSADAYPEALPKLMALGEALDRVLPCYAVAPLTRSEIACDRRHAGRLDAVLIEGHTDATPIKTPRFQSNWELSTARAAVTFARLGGDFPGLVALRNDRGAALIGVSGYGETRPADDSGSEAGMQRNRRIELRFVMAAPAVSAASDIAGTVAAARGR